MCMWQSQASAGAFSLGAAVPVEFETCWARHGRTAAIATVERFLMKVRRAIMLTSWIVSSEYRLSIGFESLEFPIMFVKNLFGLAQFSPQKIGKVDITSGPIH